MSPTKLRSDPLLNRLAGDKKEQALQALQEMVNLGSKILSPTIGSGGTVDFDKKQQNENLFTIGPEEKMAEGEKEMTHIKDK